MRSWNAEGKCWLFSETVLDCYVAANVSSWLDTKMATSTTSECSPLWRFNFQRIRRRWRSETFLPNWNCKMATISCLNPNLKHTKIIESLFIFVVSCKDIQAFIYKLCRAHVTICRSHEKICRAHEIICRAHEIICRVHDILFPPQKNFACPKYTTVNFHLI